jgi:hypothetical protein
MTRTQDSALEAGPTVTTTGTVRMGRWGGAAVVAGEMGRRKQPPTDLYTPLRRATATTRVLTFQKDILEYHLLEARQMQILRQVKELKQYTENLTVAVRLSKTVKLPPINFQFVHINATKPKKVNSCAASFIPDSSSLSSFLFTHFSRIQSQPKSLSMLIRPILHIPF